MFNEIQKYILKHKNEILIDCSNEIFTYDFISELIGMDLEEYISLNMHTCQINVAGKVDSYKLYDKQKYIIKNGDVDVDISRLCKNSNFPLSFFLKYPQLPRDGIERNKSITLYDILYTNIPWMYEELQTYNPNITLKFILENTQFNWNYSLMLRCPELTWDIITEELINIQSNKDLVNLLKFKTTGGIYDYDDIIEISDSDSKSDNKSDSDSDCVSPCLSPRDNFKNTRKLPKSYIPNHIKRNLRYFSTNPNITWDIVEKNTHIQWMYYSIFSNKNISITQLKQICLKYKKPPTKKKEHFLHVVWMKNMMMIIHRKNYFLILRIIYFTIQI